MTIPRGFEATLYSAGGFWWVNQRGRFSGAAWDEGLRQLLERHCVGLIWARQCDNRVAHVRLLWRLAPLPPLGSIAGNVPDCGLASATPFIRAPSSRVAALLGVPLSRSAYGLRRRGARTQSTYRSRPLRLRRSQRPPYVLAPRAGTVTGTIVVGSVITSAGGTPTGPLLAST